MGNIFPIPSKQLRILHCVIIFKQLFVYMCRINSYSNKKYK